MTNFIVNAITLDLDDTIWPFAPIGERVEQVLDAWMREHSPITAERFPIPAMRELRDLVYEENPTLRYDLSALRRLSLEQALVESGADIGLAIPAYEVFYAARNEVECYPDSVDALERIARLVPIAAVSNGNADLVKVGLMEYFAFQLPAREHGAAKPEASIFHAACERLNVAYGQVLHVGDSAKMDVVGAAKAGLRTCWINRDEQPWTLDEAKADLEFSTLGALADWLEQHHSSLDAGK